VSRHDADLTSLIAGLVFTALGVTYLLDAMDVVEVQVRWAVPLTLIGLGIAGLAGSVMRAHQERSPEPAGPGYPDDLGDLTDPLDLDDPGEGRDAAGRRPDDRRPGDGDEETDEETDGERAQPGAPTA
jgi:hypothetical protein